MWVEEDQVVVGDDLPEGWLLVVSQLSYAADGAKVELMKPGQGEDLNAATPASSTPARTPGTQGAPRG